MKKVKSFNKRLISSLLALVMVVSVLQMSMFSITPKASTNHSEAEAISWIKARGDENWWRDVDGVYGCQCVDLIMAYYEYLVGYRVSGNACDYLQSSKWPSGWYMDSTPAPGAIIVWDEYVYTGQWTTGKYGHVGLVYAVSGSNVYTVETNTGGTSGQGDAAAAKYRTRMNVNAKYIHPDFTAVTSAPTNLKISANHTAVAVGQTVAFNFSADGAEQLWFGLHNTETGFVYGDRFDTGSTTYTFNEPGKYYANIEAINGAGLSKSEDVYINVYDTAPSDCSVTVENYYYSKGSNVKFNISADNYESCWIGIHNQNGLYHSEPLSDKVFECTIDEPGTYYVNIEVINPLGRKTSENDYFVVYDSVPTDCKIDVNNDAINVGEDIVFTLSSKYANTHWIGIHKEDETLVYSEPVTGDTFIYTFNEPGVYYADFDAINDYGKTRSEKVWFTVGKYEITYNPNGGENAPESQTQKYNEVITLSTQVPTRDGYKFLGWSIIDNATTAIFQPGDSYGPNKDITLYAVWEEMTGDFFEIQGNIKTFGNANDDVYLMFFKPGETESCGYTTIEGDATDFCITGIEPGEYEITVIKENHVGRFYEITTDNGDINLDIQLNLIGDLNGDGKVNTLDVARANAHTRGTTSLAGYEFACVDINGDGKVNTLDVAKMNGHAKGVSSLW